jgi:hypothetical protein
MISDQAETLRLTERMRLRALVAGDIKVAEPLHAADFQLITPNGGELTKEQYLGAIASGQLKYLVWEPEDIAVRVYAESAVLRYKARLENAWQGKRNPPGQFWHTDVYEKRDGRWQVVLSQATGVLAK